MWYLFRVREMMAFLERTFGKPDLKICKEPKPSDFAGRRGIIATNGHGWSNARGHVTLWDGSLGVCSDSCHLFADPDNGLIVPEVAVIWSLR